MPGSSDMFPDSFIRYMIDENEKEKRMQFYVAGRLTNEGEIKSIIATIRELGHEITYDWTVHGSLQTDPTRWGEVSEKEIDGVRRAHIVIVRQPGGRGTHCELGGALALRKQVWMIGTRRECRDGADYDCIFHYHPNVRHFETTDELIHVLKRGALSVRESER